ncbi:MAG: hypothetical protein NDI67_09560 [Sulfuritalea sp.]|nr:hypothetical protein [Sulfuritalea sp.]
MKRCLAICCTALLTACSSFPWPPGQADAAYWIRADAARPASRVESLLAYAEYVRGLSSTESAREHERLRLAFAAKDRSDFVRLQYVMLLSVAAGPGRDLPRARQLLEPLLKEEGHDIELRRLAAHLHAASGELLDAERRSRDEQRRASDEQRRANEEQRRAADLDQKLEALKSIEQRMIKRSSPEKPR